MFLLSCALLVSLVSLVSLVAPGRAAASSSGGVLTFTPSGGPVGAQVTVTVTITVELPGPTPYLLSATPNDPAQRGCGDGVTLPDTPKFIVISGQPATTTFTWPTALDSGVYYLCASPAADQKGPTVWSQQPFSVTGVLLSGSGPTPTPTPSDSGVAAYVPSDGVTVGGNFTLIVDASVALGGNAPSAITLLELENLSAVRVHWAQTARDGTIYTYDVSVPGDAQPGLYQAQVLAGNDGLTATSQPFHVVGGPRSSPPLVSVPGTTATSPAGALLVAIIALLLALAVASLLWPLRWRHLARRPPDAPTHCPRVALALRRDPTARYGSRSWGPTASGA